MSLKERVYRLTPAVALAFLLVQGGIATYLLANCGPFTDVGPQICAFVLEVYYSGISAGTTSTTFSPNNPVTRGQMAVFLSQTLDRSIQRGSRRAALNQWWTTTPHYDLGLGITQLSGAASGYLWSRSDGEDVWVSTGNT